MKALEEAKTEELRLESAIMDIGALLLFELSTDNVSNMYANL